MAFPLAAIPFGIALGKKLFGKKGQEQQPQMPPQLGFPGTNIGQLAQQGQMGPFAPRPGMLPPAQVPGADPFAMTPNVQQTETVEEDPRLRPAPTQFPMPEGPKLKRRGLLRGLKGLEPEQIMMAQKGGMFGLLGLLAGSALKKTPGGM